LAILASLLPTVALAASLSFAPSSGDYEPGTTFKVGIYAASDGVALNAVSGTVSFPASSLEVVSLSKNQSIVSLWVQEPSFSNADGIIRFEGIVLNPGYTGSNGKILDVTFVAKSPSTPSLTFSAGSILANDGEGTEILSSRNRAEYVISAVPAADSQDTEEASVVDEAVASLIPTVTSLSHPLGAWSNETTATFEFGVPEEVTSMRLLVDDLPDSVPTVVYTPPLTTKTIEGLEEGVSYLHVQYRSAAGWGEVLHYEMKVDTKEPEGLTVREVNQDTYLLSASDGDSTVERFEVQIDSGEVYTVAGGTNVFVVPDSLVLSEGQHTLTVRAYDLAGNMIVTDTTFAYVPTPALDKADVSVSDARATLSPVYNFLLPRGAILIAVLSVIVPSLALIFLLVALLYVAWRALGGLKRRVDKEVKEANEILRRAFFTLRSDLEVDIETLKKANLKRKLTREESKIMKRLRVNIDTAEQVIGKEISDIEKEVE